MTLNVQYTEADFREASAAVRGQRLQSVSMAWFFFVFLAFVAGSAVGDFLQARAPGQPARGPADVFGWLIPFPILAAYWAFISFRTGGKRAPGFVAPPPPLRGVGFVLPAMLTVGLFTACLIAHAYTPPAPPPQDQPPMPIGEALATLILPLIPMSALVICSIVLFLRIFAGNVRRMYDLQVHLHRPMTIEITPESLTVSSDGVRHEYGWRAIIGWNETPNLFLLFTSYVTFHMVPKRAFPVGAHDLYNEFQLILHHEVGERRRGFDVMPPAPGGPATPPPLPPSHGQPVPIPISKTPGGD